MILIKFKASPARAIRGTVSMPEPKTMAFGGVATGSIKAYEHAMVTGKNKHPLAANSRVEALPDSAHLHGKIFNPPQRTEGLGLPIDFCPGPAYKALGNRFDSGHQLAEKWRK